MRKRSVGRSHFQPLSARNGNSHAHHSDTGAHGRADPAADTTAHGGADTATHRRADAATRTTSDRVCHPAARRRRR
ncbi:MAG TPA: hypothetical protein VIN65_03950 [Candidatus Dormibacteraeota bacterium]